jgi:hypothetical protein
MRIEKEIRNYLHGNLKELDTKSRDIDLVLYFYGFGKDLWPTLEDAAIEFDVGDSGGRRSERPRQIINKKFRSLTSLSDITSLKQFSEYLESSPIHSSFDVNEYANTNELLGEKLNLVSLLRLLNDLNECKSYKAYSLDLNELTRSAYSKNQEILIAQKSSIKTLQKSLKKAKTIPGLLGVAKLEYLMEELELNRLETETLVLLIKSDPDSWFYNFNGEDYYLFESRDNTLINSLEKIKNVTSSEDINILTKVLANSLKRRTAPKKRSYPPEGVIKKYLLSSKYTEVNESIIQLKVEKEELTDIEQAVTDYLSEFDVNDYPTISSHLISLNYSKPLVEKTVFYSPLIYVDKSAGRYHYNFNLIGRNVLNTTNISTYENFRQKLIKASSDGTDGSSTVVTRKEHYILSEWLFEGKETELCAICEKPFSVKSLVTAHKKKRKDCAENERTDPYVVMPLCVFGCDYLYEKRLIYIESGVVKAIKDLEKNYKSELSFINDIIGNNLGSRWLKGSESYFPKPNKKNTIDA